jgi:hypothetical protein
LRFHMGFLIFFARENHLRKKKVKKHLGFKSKFEPQRIWLFFFWVCVLEEEGNWGGFFWILGERRWGKNEVFLEVFKKKEKRQ